MTAISGDNDAARVPDGRRVYAIGDIHGRADLLEALLARIRADADAAPAEHQVAVFLGDYVDRGAESRTVLDMLAADPLPGFECHFLAGNHDAWMIAFLDGLDDGTGWFMNGGDATLRSYDVEPALLPMGPGGGRTAALREALKERVPPSHERFLKNLTLTHREGDYLFVHAGIRPGVPLERQSAEDLLWIRGEFLYSQADHGVVVVHGHTPTREVDSQPNRIGIDTGAFMTNQLTCLVLDGAKRHLLQT